MLILKGSKVGERVTAIFDKIIKGRPGVEISKSVTFERPSGEREIVDVRIKATGDVAEKLISDFRSAAALFDARPSQTPPTIEHDPLAGGARTAAPAKAPALATETQQKRARKAPAKEAAAEPAKPIAPRKRAGAKPKRKGR